MGMLEGKVALVTGAGRHGGLGQAICARLAVEGCRVALTEAMRSLASASRSSVAKSSAWWVNRALVNR